MDYKLFGQAFRGDKIIWCVFIALCIISLLEVFSATSTIAYKQQNYWAPVIRHGVFLLIGFALVMGIQRMRPRVFGILVLGVFVSALLLIITMSLGETVNGAQRWLGIGSFTIQPSELAKLSAIGATAFALSKMNEKNEFTIFKTIMIGLVALCGLIVTENLSTAVLLFFVCFLMMYLGQVKFKWLALTALAGILAVVLIVGILKVIPDESVDKYGRIGTWKSRVEKFTQGSEHEELSAETFKITDDNYQVSNAKIAIANGGIAGLPGSGVQRDFLPQAYSDFIFAIILEEMGLAGGLIVILLYIVLMIRCGILAKNSKKKFPRYLILGCGLMLTTQALINMAVAVNMIPVTGQPLPLVSRGGTSTIITCLYFGVILACSAKQNVVEHASVDESIANVDFGIAENE